MRSCDLEIDVVSDVDGDVGSDVEVVAMSTAGYVQEGKQQRRHRTAYGCLVFVALVLLFLVTTAATLSGWYLINHRYNYNDLFYDTNQHGSHSDPSQPAIDAVLDEPDDYHGDTNPPSNPDYTPYKPHESDVIIPIISTTVTDYVIKTIAPATTTTTTLPPTTTTTTTAATTSTTTSTTTTTTTPVPTTTTRRVVDDANTDGAKTSPDEVNPNREVSELIAKLWEASQDKYLAAGPDYTLNFQGKTTADDVVDRASKRLFQQLSKSLKKAKRQYGLYRRFFDLFDNFNPEHGEPEAPLQREVREVDMFLEELLACETFKILNDYIADTRPLLQIDTFKSLLRRLWFEPSDASSTPFERVFIGERNRTHVLGLNNWLRVSQLEKEKSLDYQGYINKYQLGILEARYNWAGRVNPSSTFFVGTSPDFEMAMYTLCYVVHPNGSCAFTLQGYNIAVITSHNGVEVNFVLKVTGSDDNR